MTFNLLAGPTGPSGPQGPDNGIVKLASGLITGPRLDLVLPAGYPKFRIEIDGVRFSINDHMAVIFSQDGGVTYISDVINFDTYRNIQDNYTAAVSGDHLTDAPIAQNYSDAVGSIGNDINPTSGLPWDGTYVLLQGDGVNFARCFGADMASGATAPDIGLMIGGIFYLNPAATVPPSKARVTNIRFTPAGNAATNPPSSDATFTMGSYVLWGIQL